MDLPELTSTENRDVTGLIVWFFNLGVRYTEGPKGDLKLYREFFRILKSRKICLNHLQDMVRSVISELGTSRNLPTAREIFFRLCESCGVERKLCGWYEEMPEVPPLPEEVEVA